jgi:hypothetical protein
MASGPGWILPLCQAAEVSCRGRLNRRATISEPQIRHDRRFSRSAARREEQDQQGHNADNRSCIRMAVSAARGQRLSVSGGTSPNPSQPSGRARSRDAAVDRARRPDRGSGCGAAGLRSRAGIHVVWRKGMPRAAVPAGYRRPDRPKGGDVALARCRCYGSAISTCRNGQRSVDVNAQDNGQAWAASGRR